jgi:hypothetical protein
VIPPPHITVTDGKMPATLKIVICIFEFKETQLGKKPNRSLGKSFVRRWADKIRPEVAQCPELLVFFLVNPKADVGIKKRLILKNPNDDILTTTTLFAGLKKYLDVKLGVR